jgi:hypothetical protein
LADFRQPIRFFDMTLKRVRSSTFQEQTIPQGARLAGAAALAHELELAVPVRRPSCVAGQHIRGSRRADGKWTVFDKRYWPGNEFADHLIFFLRHEVVDLLVLRRVFEAAPPQAIKALVRRAPSATHVRKAWFLYEAVQRIMEAVEMPDRVTENLVMFIRRNGGTLSKSRRQGEFKQLTEDEVHHIERIVTEAFTGFTEAPGASSEPGDA